VISTLGTLPEHESDGTIDFLKEGAVVARGAEAVLLEGELLGFPVVIKRRLPKPYRDSGLDYRLRFNRTYEEGRLLAKAARAGVSVPLPIFIDPPTFTIVESRVRGRILKDVTDQASSLMKFVGVQLAKLHLSGVVHGDFTTSNVLVDQSGTPFIIDFGLGSSSTGLEERGVDLLLMKKSLEANAPSLAKQLFSDFFEGYRETFGEGSDDVLRRSGEIEKRGRYYAERAFERDLPGYLKSWKAEGGSLHNGALWHQGSTSQGEEI